MDDFENMKKSIWVIFKHIIKDDSKSMEEPRSQTTDMWFKFWHKKIHGSKTYEGVNRLPNVFLKELKPIFTRLSDDALLKRCLHGLTQNQNEAINGVLWANCPKTKFCGVRKVELVVCETICKFNTGAEGRMSILEAIRVKPGRNMLTGFRKDDDDRVKNAERKCSLKTCSDRRKRRRERKSKNDKNNSTNVSYFAGGLGLGLEPEIDIGIQAKVTFVDEKDIPILVIGN